MAAGSAAAQISPRLGVARQFAVLGGAGVNATGTGMLIIGDIGASTETSVHGIDQGRNVAAPFSRHLTNDALVRRARRDANRAYAELLGRGSGTVLPDNLALAGPLTAGTYSFVNGAPYLPAHATLTLTGGGVFIFNVNQSLTAEAASHVAGSAEPCDIYWRVGTASTLLGETFRGTVLAGGSITLGTGARLAGRALAGPAGTVTLGGGSAIVDCSVITVVPWSPAWWQIALLTMAISYVTFLFARAKIRTLPEW